MRKNEKQKIVKGAKKGSLEDFKRLYDTFYMRLVRYAVSYVDDMEIAEDVVQDVFLKIWERRKEPIIINSINSYLFRAVHNTCIQHLRHQIVCDQYKTRQQLRLKEAELLYSTWDRNNTDPWFFREIKQITETTLNSLSPKTREIFSLSRDKLLTNKEISNLMEVDIKTVEYHIGKALKIFREKLKDYLIFLIIAFLY